MVSPLPAGPSPEFPSLMVRQVRMAVSMQDRRILPAALLVTVRMELLVPVEWLVPAEFPVPVE